jgi:hypothetical protein
VLVPLGLRLLSPERRPLGWRAAVALQLPAALLLLVSFSWPVGRVAAALAVPWLICTGLTRLWSQCFSPPEELCIDAGMVNIAIGGGWTVLSRFGASPLRQLGASIGPRERGFRPLALLQEPTAMPQPRSTWCHYFEVNGLTWAEGMPVIAKLRRAVPLLRPQSGPSA